MTFRKGFSEFVTLILGILIFFSFPLILILILLTFGTYFYFIKISAKWFKSDFGKIMNLRSQVFAADLMYTDPRGTVVIGQIIQGNLDIETLKENITQNLLKSTHLNGDLKYPELKQYLTFWMGYRFWKDDKTFDLSRHVTIQNPNNSLTYSDSEMEDIYENLVLKPWTKNRPIWELILVPNYYPNKGEGTTQCTVMFLRFHHCLGDGHSFLKLVAEGISDLKALPKNAHPTYPQPNFLKSLVFFLIFPFRAAYELSQVCCHHLFTCKIFMPLQDLKEKYHIRMTNKIEIKQIKEIKNHFKVSFASVVNAVVAGGLRDFLMSKGQKVPDFLIQGGVLPLPGHPNKLRIFVTGGINFLPIGEADPIKRLTFCSTDYQNMKRSTFPVLARFFHMLCGLIPSRIIRILMNQSIATIGSTIFPAGYQNVYYQGFKCVDLFAVPGIGPLGICVSAISYVDGLRISILSKHSLMTKDELINLVELMQDNVNILLNRLALDI